MFNFPDGLISANPFRQLETEKFLRLVQLTQF